MTGSAMPGHLTSFKVGGHFGAKGSSLNDRGAGDPKRRFNYASERSRSGTWSHHRHTESCKPNKTKQNKTKHHQHNHCAGPDASLRAWMASVRLCHAPATAKQKHPLQACVSTSTPQPAHPQQQARLQPWLYIGSHGSISAPTVSG